MSENIDILRRKLLIMLQDYTGIEPLKINLEQGQLEKILFDAKTHRFAISPYLLTKLDFSNVSFKGVIIEDIDFTNLKNVYINPQELYSKSVSGSILSGVTFTGTFDDMVIMESDFTCSHNAFINPLTIKLQTLYRCKLSDVTFTESLDKVNFPESDFTGSHNGKVSFAKLAKKYKENKEYIDNLKGLEYLEITDIKEIKDDGILLKFQRKLKG